MCGITGFIDFSRRFAPDDLRAVIGRMTDTLVHRGPDDGGVWVDAEAGIALGHRRLSILDLSPAGCQPMTSGSGRYVIVFNGEIYNFRQLRRELEEALPEAKSWRGHSDTEVMLAAFETWGVAKAVPKFTGMFSIALWDRQERLLYLVRDRTGEKPLYYGWSGQAFLFGSELKACRAYPGFNAVIDRNALSLLLRHNYIPTPYSIYQGIGKLLPGTILTIPLAGTSPGLVPDPQPYWSARSVVELGIADPFAGSESEAISRLDDLLRQVIAGQMVADVPVGAFLSGGVDSSAIVALMQTQSTRPVKTFTIGFSESGYNEADHAKAVALHLGTEHTELYISPKDALSVIPRLPVLYDEPFSDSSQIPTFLVSQMTRNHVTVSLSGDAGDELFGGYNRHAWGQDIWKIVGCLPRFMRNAGKGALTALSPETWDRIFDRCGKFLPGQAKPRTPGDKLHKLAEALTAQSPEMLYMLLVSHWKNPESVVIGSTEPLTAITDKALSPALSGFTDRMMYLDLVSYLRDDILVKVDRAAMGVGLETRIPFLDQRVIEFAWRLPMSMKVRDGQGKWILRQVLDAYVPRILIERPKTGFAVPIDVWLRGPLRDWAEALLDEKRLRDEGFFNPAPIREKWTEHLSGKRNWQHHLWDVLMFQAWLDSTKG